MDRPEPSPAPPRSVLGSFSLEGQRRLMAGGRGRAWRVGEAVLKRVDVPLAQLGWQASLFDSLQAQTAFRVPTAVMSREGSLTVEGWYAMTFLRGRHEPGRWVEIISAGEAFHSAVASEPRPAFLDERTDPWSIGDRAAWGEIEIPDLPETKHLARLVAHLTSLDASPQLIHGDLTGNVLFDDALPPAILDLSPYFRPVSFATAVVVADALAWEGADSSLLQHFDRSADFPQCLLRAVIYRVVTDRLFRLDQPLRSDDDDPYLRVVDLAVARASQAHHGPSMVTPVTSEEIRLSGGAVTEGVVRVGDTVRRPPSHATQVVRDVLLHLERVGFDAAPRWLGVDDQGRDIVTWIEGETFTDRSQMHPYIGDPTDRVTFSAEQVASAMLLLRRYHDTFGPDVVCHGDFGPWNLVWRSGLPVAIIDFDDAYPGDPGDDVAYALRMFISYGFSVSEPGELVRRTEAALSAYGRRFDVPVILDREYDHAEDRCRRNGWNRELARLPIERAWLATNHALF